MASKKRVTISYCLMQIVFWGMLGPFCGYQTSLMLSRGFSPAQAGIFVSVSYAASILTQPAICRWADRHPAFPLKALFAGMMLPAIALNAVLYFTRPGFWVTALLFFLFGTLETNSYPLIDAMVMQYVNTGMDVPYSLGRGLGSLAYALTGILAGFLARRYGVGVVLVAHCVLQLLMAACALAYPTFPRSALPKRPAGVDVTHSALHLLRTNKPFALMLAGGFFGMMAVMPLSSFLVMQVQARGGDNGDLGVAVFLMAASELPSAFLFQQLYRRMRCDRILLISVFFMMAMPLCQYFSRTLAALQLVQLLQMLGYGLYSPASVYFANETVAPEDRVQGQSLKTTLTNSMGSLVGNLASGAIITAGGTQTMLLVGASSGLIGLIFAFLAVRAGRAARAAA